MKQIQVKVPSNQAEVIEDMTNQYELESSQVETVDGDRLFYITIPDDQSNNLLHELKARGVGVVFGSIVLIPINVSLSKRVIESKIKRSSAANVEEILADLEESATISVTYIALVILSGALAAFGLMEDSIVIIIGSMIIAPLLGPVALTSIGVLIPERGILRKGLASEIVGILLTVGIGYLIGVLFPPVEPTAQMIERAQGAIENASANVAFAVVSGIAAGVIISRGQGLSIVGVAIAAALAPPAANIGIYFAINDPVGALFAAALLFMNILAINASCSIIFSIFRLPSKAGISKRRASKAKRANTILTLITLVGFIGLSIALIFLPELLFER